MHCCQSGGDTSNRLTVWLVRTCSSLSTDSEKDPWCQGKATATRALVVIALLESIASLVFSSMATLNIKTPTWDGEGRETTLVKPLLCSFCSLLALLPAVIAWYQMVVECDKLCQSTMAIVTFICISTGSTYAVAISAIPFVASTYWLWRLAYSYQVRDSMRRVCCVK